jgi:hypothetical protein
MKRTSSFALAVLTAALLLPACSSTDTGDRPPADEAASNVTAMHGIVRYVDTEHRTMEIESGTTTVSVEYKKNAQIRRSEKISTPADLERGDEIDFRLVNTGHGRPRAEEIVVTHNAEVLATASTSGIATVRGSVLSVDIARRIISLDQTTFRNGTTGGSNRPGLMVVRYNANTSVEDNGRANPVDSLERGNVVEIVVEHNNLSDFRATRIVLIRDTPATSSAP